eukprot:TRINITY_DN7178_c0_g1_i1.p3 TRINITY_DN7178_c0_g1~~TRINITY_DN7178_c0_g1_i1.p3  ORF type:complete len:102 (-),score=9.70 TRINITY_DN7178_c0_g1_i1:23-328(-)
MCICQKQVSLFGGGVYHSCIKIGIFEQIFFNVLFVVVFSFVQQLSVQNNCGNDVFWSMFGVYLFTVEQTVLSGILMILIDVESLFEVGLKYGRFNTGRGGH